jgi:hypothetical protein
VLKFIQILLNIRVAEEAVAKIKGNQPASSVFSQQSDDIRCQKTIVSDAYLEKRLRIEMEHFV